MPAGGSARGAMRAAARAYSVLLDACGFAAGAAITVMAVLVTVNVVLRGTGVGNLPWLLEVSEYAIYIATFMAAPWALRLGAHVRVDLLLTVTPGAAGRIINYVADTAGLVCALILARHGFNVASEAFARGDVLFKELVVPEWPLLAVIPVSGVLLAIEFAHRLARPSPDAAKTAEHPADGL